LLGGRIDAGVPALRILSVGQVIAASAGSQMQVMAMTGHERTAAARVVAGRLPIPSRAPRRSTCSGSSAQRLSEAGTAVGDRQRALIRVRRL